MPRIKLLLLQGGPSREHDVSLNSGRMVFQALNAERYDVRVDTIAKNSPWTPPKKGDYDVAFIAMHGAFGEDGTIQELLDGIALPYTGSGAEASALAMDKAASAALFQKIGLRTPTFVHATEKNAIDVLGRVLFPAVVKPCHGGSSIDVSIVYNGAAAALAIQNILHTGDSAIIQELIQGRELTCGVLDDEDGKPQALPPTEIIPVPSAFFDYTAKYQAGASREVTPPNLPFHQIAELQRAALAAHQALGCSGMSRSDFVLRGDALYILETNTIPGMTATSLFPQAAKVAGIEFPDMLERILQGALKSRQV